MASNVHNKCHMSTTSHNERSSGVLLHATSLPGPFGIGDLGPTAFRWLETLAAARQVWWQLLPVGPTGYGDSPYQSPSTFAGNPNLISPEALRNEKLASTSEIDAAVLPDGPVDYTSVIANKQRLIATAFERFQAGDAEQLRTPFQKFIEQEREWLDDYALFAAIKEHERGRPWWKWPRSLAFREQSALAAISEKLKDQIDSQRFGQFLFYRQWAELRRYGVALGIRLFGDLPIYVAEDSAEVWRYPELFMLDVNRRPTEMAGVPPDYFSATGQLWGNPPYRWETHRATAFAWWTQRIRSALRLFDQVRLDHFRGIEAFWAVPAGEETAVNGRWLPGPGEELLSALADNLGRLPIVAEDLGVITPAVDRLREQFGLLGMRILQFAFGGAVEGRFLPHNFNRDLLVATGTHDNDTSRGWFAGLDGIELRSFAGYVPGAQEDPVWSLIRTAWASVAAQAVAPLQDLLDLPTSARMNKPGTASGNWRWRAREKDTSHPAWVERLAVLSRVYQRTSPIPA